MKKESKDNSEIIEWHYFLFLCVLKTFFLLLMLPAGFTTMQKMEGSSCPWTPNGAIRIANKSKYSNHRLIGLVIDQPIQLCKIPQHQFWNHNLSLINGATFNHQSLIDHHISSVNIVLT